MSTTISRKGQLCPCVYTRVCVNKRGVVRVPELSGVPTYAVSRVYIPLCRLSLLFA